MPGDPGAGRLAEPGTGPVGDEEKEIAGQRVTSVMDLGARLSISQIKQYYQIPADIKDKQDC